MALVGLYGGTFNPIHVGHIHAALSVQKAFNLDEIRMVLSARPGHRREPDVSAEHRWRMLQLACEAHDGLLPDDTELLREGKSFTVRTLEELHASTPGVIACWILGQDSFATLAAWHRWEELMDLCNLLVLDRPGLVLPEPAEVVELCATRETASLDPTRQGQIVRLPLSMKEVSSTQVRRRINAGIVVTDLLEEPVSTYIKAHNLYTNPYY